MKKALVLIVILTMLLGIEVFGTSINELTDINKTDWYYDALEKIVNKDIIVGYPNKTFKPNNNISRAEFTKTIRVALGLDIVEGNVFVDTERHWAKDEINTAVENLIIDKSDYGYSFIPDKNITRIEMAKMVVRALGLDNKAKEKNGEITSFLDDLSISEQDKGYVIIAAEKGIIKGYEDKTFKPKGQATRAEAAQMLVNMLNVIEGSVGEVPVNKDYITDAQKLDTTPIEKTDYDYLKEYQKKDLRGNVKYEVEGIVEADKSLFPIKFGNIVVTGIEKIEAENAPYNGDTSFYWKGANGKDAIVIHAYAINKNDETGVTNGYWLRGLELGFKTNDNTFNISTIATIAETDTIHEKTKEIFENYAFGEHPKVSLNKEFSTMFILDRNVELGDIDKLILLDTMYSVGEGLEFDIDKID